MVKNMVFLGEIIDILDAQMPRPVMYGWFHILFLVFTVVVCIVLCKAYKDTNEALVRRLLFISGSVVLLFEVYKQLNFTVSYDGVQIIVDYPWYIFPFQFCSTPMYVSILAAVAKNRKLHNAFCAYLASYAVFAGCCVMVYPGAVFIGTIGVNIQTMICHGTMVVVGVYLLKTGYTDATFRTILRAFPVFITCVAIATVLNEIAFWGGLLNNETFNMFFISPHRESTLPVYSFVHKALPYPCSVLCYIVGFSIAAYLVLLAAKVFKSMRRRETIL